MRENVPATPSPRLTGHAGCCCVRQCSEPAKQNPVGIFEKPSEKRAFCPHKSKNARTDGKIAARTGSWPARNGRSPARIEKWPHGPENARTDREIGARKWKLPAQTGKSPARSDFPSHGVFAVIAWPL
jgi:hypothetical protein